MPEPKTPKSEVDHTVVDRPANPVAAWIVSDPFIKWLAKKFNIPEPLLVALNIKNQKVLERVAVAHKIAIDREYYEAYAASYDRIQFFGRPETIRIDRVKKGGEDYVRVAIRFKTAQVLWHIPLGEWQKKTPEEWLAEFRNYMYIVARRVEVTRKTKGKDNKGRKERIMWWEAERVRIVKADENVALAKRLVEIYANRYKMPYLVAGAVLLGFHPEMVWQNKQLMILVMSRLLPAISPEPIHYCEFGVKGIGKSHTAWLYEIALSWKFYAEVPSLATLVGDARTGAAIIARVSGIWFDEFDTWVADSRKRSELKDLIEVLLTGMWQGVWKRSKGGVHSIEVFNPIPVVLTGNISGAMHPREKIKSIIMTVSMDKVEPFNDRIMVALTVAKHGFDEVVQSSTLEYFAGKPVMGRPSVLKGYVMLMQELIARHGKEPRECPFKARRREAYRRVYRALSILLADKELKVDEHHIAEIAKLLVEGYIIT